MLVWVLTAVTLLSPSDPVMLSVAGILTAIAVFWFVRAIRQPERAAKNLFS